MNFGQLLFGFQGRINRGKYWLAALIYFIFGLVIATIGYFAEEAPAFQILNAVVSIGVLISSIAVGLRRLHDRDKSGWWLLLFYLVPSLLWGIGAVAFFYGVGAEAAGGMIAGGVLGVLGVAGLGVHRTRLPARHIGAEPVWSRSAGCGLAAVPEPEGLAVRRTFGGKR